MNAPILYIPLAIEWVILITALMPRLLVGMFYNVPRFALTLWFTYFISSVLAAAAAIVITFWALLELLQYSADTKLLAGEVGSQLGLWLMVAVSGVAIALVNLRTEPLVQEASVATQALAATAKPLGVFQKVQLYEVAFPAPLAFATKISSKPAIVISNSALASMGKAEIEAIYWHELGHIRGRHNLLKSVARLVSLLTPNFRASKFFRLETDHLVELTADNFAKKHVSETTLRSAREKFLE